MLLVPFLPTVPFLCLFVPFAAAGVEFCSRPSRLQVSLMDSLDFSSMGRTHPAASPPCHHSAKFLMGINDFSSLQHLPSRELIPTQGSGCVC